MYFFVCFSETQGVVIFQLPQHSLLLGVLAAMRVIGTSSVSETI